MYVCMYSVDNIHDGKKWERHACSRVMMPGAVGQMHGNGPTMLRRKKQKVEMEAEGLEACTLVVCTVSKKEN